MSMPIVRRVTYFKMMVPNRPGQGARALSVLHQAGINLVAFSGFPHRGGAQMDFIPAKPSAFRKVARKNKWKIAAPKRAFLVRGADRVGAGAKLMAKLAAKRINVIAIDAVHAGSGRYGAILWVSPGQYSKAARVLGAR
jgi:hypothetical protein